jgi:protease-4
MRLLFALAADLVWALRALLELPLRAFRPRLAYVTLRLKGELPYRPARRRFRQAGASVKGVFALLDRLERDPRLEGVVLSVDALQLSPAKREALAGRLRRFRQAGKKVVGHAVSAGNAEYELLCAADRIYLSPAGRLDLIGFAAEVMALGKGLAQVGVHAEFVRRGDFKTAPELFTDAEISDVQRQTLEGFLDTRHEALVTAIAAGRDLTVEAVRQRIDDGPYSARRAVEAQLVDGLATEQGLRALLMPEVKPAKPDAPPRGLPSLGEYRRARLWRPRPARRYRLGDRVSVVPLTGMITSGEGSVLPFGPRTLGSDAVIRAVDAAASAPTKAMVLFVDSPGGSAIASELMLEAIQRAAARKPLVAYVDRVAASGGYMAAMGGKELWSAPHAIIGSIGVFAGKFDASVLLERLGVRREVISRGAHAGMGSFARPFSPSERAALEREVEETYQAFLAQVAQARGQTSEWVHARGEGRVFSGARALELGLVDRLGGFEAACLRALELAGKPAPSRVELVLHPPAPKSRHPLERLLPSHRPSLFALWWPWLEVPDLGVVDSMLGGGHIAVTSNALIEWVRSAMS